MTEPKYFVRDDATEWKDSTTLDEWVIKQIEEKRTSEVEFQLALQFWGRKKFEEIWRRHMARKKGASRESTT